MWCVAAPTAFGLVTYLRASAWPISQVQQALLVFALASPIVTILTFLLLMLVPGLASHVRPNPSKILGCDK